MEEVYRQECELSLYLTVLLNYLRPAVVPNSLNLQRLHDKQYSINQIFFKCFVSFMKKVQ